MTHDPRCPGCHAKPTLKMDSAALLGLDGFLFASAPCANERRTPTGRQRCRYPSAVILSPAGQSYVFAPSWRELEEKIAALTMVRA